MTELPGENRKRYVVYVQTENRDPSDEVLLEDVYVFSSDIRAVALSEAERVSREEGPTSVWDTCRASRLTGHDATLIAVCENGRLDDGRGGDPDDL